MDEEKIEKYKDVQAMELKMNDLETNLLKTQELVKMLLIINE